jgi:hypothetical protein
MMPFSVLSTEKRRMFETSGALLVLRQNDDALPSAYPLLLSAITAPLLAESFPESF